MAFNPLSPEWPKQTADQIERFAQRIRSTFTAKAVTATNAVVFGLVAAFAGLVAMILGVVILVRAVQAYLTWDLDTVALWIVGAVAALGLLFVLVGIVKSSKGLIGVGALLVVVTGARWALDMGDTRIDHDTSVWISYLLVGGLFLFAGTALMARRHAVES